MIQPMVCMVTVLSGVSVGFAAYGLGSWLVGQAASGEGRGPDAVRALLPTPIAWLWPCAQRLAGPIQRLLRPGWGAKVDSLLSQAGLAYWVSAAEFVSTKILMALMVGLAGGAMTALTGLPAAGTWFIAGACGFLIPDQWLRGVVHRRQSQILKSLPFFLDLTALALESGRNLSGAIQRAVERMKAGPLRDEMLAVSRDVRAGRARVEALRSFASRVNIPAVTSLVAILVQGELTGASLAPVLRAMADQRRAERFYRAEKLAMEAPVRMLAPLVLLIFPCTFLVIGFPIARRIFSSGLGV